MPTTSEIGWTSKSPPSLGITSLPKAEAQPITLSYPFFLTRPYTIYAITSPVLILKRVNYHFKLNYNLRISKLISFSNEYFLNVWV